ncbi:hypothetical protein [Paraburkholderia sediminicola]
MMRSINYRLLVIRGEIDSALAVSRILAQSRAVIGIALSSPVFT